MHVLVNAIAEKQALRRTVRDLLRGLSLQKQADDSRRACETLFAQPHYADAASLLLYMPLQGELDVRLIMDKAILEGKNVALPRFIPETGLYGAFFIGGKPLIPGPFGAFEPCADHPVPLNRLDLIVTPGLAFDLRGWRLGRGKGFYDRLLAEATGVKCGICFDEQVLPEIPTEPHDVGVQFLATPSRWQECRGATPELQ